MRQSVIAMILALSIAPAGALAADAVLPASHENPTVLELGHLQSEIAILKAKLELAKLKSDISKSSGGGTVLVQEPEGALPQVMTVQGMGGNLTADIALPDGGAQTVRKGSVLGNMRVVSVTRDGVSVSRSGRIEMLPFSDGGAQFVRSGTQGNPVMPGMVSPVPRMP